ncbi:hypothetical protein [Acetobacterium wieringae]|uniref:hypothetical protein n=1 Tax=Acetobacterium wieringae TaxID=52694 RepID=UPI002B21E00A|nr:hypothetical protein [Acetobacterium wieringae]
MVMKKPPIQQTFLAKDVEITSFMLFLISGFLRPFLVIEKENSRVLITMICFSVLNIPIVNLFTWELKNKY